ncbi:hypothetical protein M0R72_02225 [Candidatus Pacearchaeota archaeon]|nr:hypothetical protein [Candidatus Pacearchaeota archaeon]
MALELVQPGTQPLGQFDGADGIYLTVKGGEVATIKGVTVNTDSSAYDTKVDGYVKTTRPVATTALIAGDRPLMLVDDGIWGYGTLFGSVIGGIAGQQAYGLGQPPAVQLGPHTALGSGKLTLWDKPGTYAVTLDAVDTAVTTGLMPTNDSLQIGAKLYATSTGLLTPNSAVSFDSVADGYCVIGRFLNFEAYKGGSLVTTPVSLVTAAYAPGPGAPANGGMARALIYFAPPMV